MEHSGWHCNGCGASNLALRDRCYKCSFGISQVQLNDLKEEREELLAGGVGVPDRTSIKRGGTKRKRGGARSRAAGNSAGAAASSSAAGPSDGKGGSRGSPVDTTDRAVPESRGDEGWSGREWWDYSRGRWSSWGWQEDHREWEDHCGDRQGRDDYYEDNHYGGSREDRRDWDDYYGSRREDGYYEDRRQDYHEDRHWDREDDRTGWQDWNDRDDQEDEQYGRAYWRSRRKLPRQSALAYKSGSSSKKQLFADEELLALVPVSDRSSFESEFGSVEERSALVRLVGVRGFTLRGFVWGALCFAAAVLSSTRDVVLLGLRCLWCLSAAVRNRLAHSLNGNQDGLYPWILCGIISLATYRVGEEFADGAAAVVRVTTEAIEDVFETTSIEVQETIQWVGMFVRMALVVAVWYVGRTCWSKLMHVLHGNTATPTKGPTGNVEAWRFLLNEPPSTRPIGICSRVAVEGAETIYQVEGSNGASYRSVLHDTDRSKIRCSCKAYVFSGKHCKHLVEIARRESVHGTEKDAPAAELPLAIARGRAASTAQALAVQAQANSCLDGLSVLMQKAATISSRGYGRTLSSENSRQPLPSPERIDAGNFADTPLQGIKKAKEGPKELVRVPSPTVRPAEPELAVKFVPNFTSQQILVDSLREWPKCDVTLVAYSFDQPQVVEALESHQGRTRLLADLSQTNGKTKQQYQVYCCAFKGRVAPFVWDPARACGTPIWRIAGRYPRWEVPSAG